MAFDFESDLSSSSFSSKRRRIDEPVKAARTSIQVQIPWIPLAERKLFEEVDVSDYDHENGFRYGQRYVRPSLRRAAKVRCLVGGCSNIDFHRWPKPGSVLDFQGLQSASPDKRRRLPSCAIACSTSGLKVAVVPSWVVAVSFPKPGHILVGQLHPPTSLRYSQLSHFGNTNITSPHQTFLSSRWVLGLRFSA